jgi:sugar/nucleoside kinase (ribokinase family)
MKFIIIGEPCFDVIHKLNGETYRGLGGILYSLVSLSVLCRDEDELFPVMNLGADQYAGVMNFFKQYRNINTDGIKKTEFPTRKVFLDYGSVSGGKDRKETSSMPTAPIEFEQIEPFLDGAEAMLVNMISGVDITIDTLRKVRSRFKGFIHMDIHNIVMTTREDGAREYVRALDGIEWCVNADTVQMNETELSYIGEGKMTEYKIAEEILINSPQKAKAMILTRGSDGVSCYTTTEKEYGGEKFIDLDKKDLMAIDNPDFADSTGCGDVFASAFVYDYMRTKDINKALHFANRMASYKTSLEGIDNLYKLVN